MNKIEVKQFNFFYGDFQALQDISLDFHENEVTALIGPSGCGKSTLGQAMMGYLRSGSQLLGGGVKFIDQDMISQLNGFKHGAGRDFEGLDNESPNK